MINPAELDVLRSALRELETGFTGLPEFTPELDIAGILGLEEAVGNREDDLPWRDVDSAANGL